jgi:hypothetical protein
MDVGNVCAFLTPAGLAWVLIGAGVLLAVALRAHVKHALWIVVTRDVPGRIGTTFAELDSHVPTPNAKRRAASSSRHLLVVAEILDISSPAIGFSD